MHAIVPLLKRCDFPAIRRRSLATLQVNLGYRCNQSCVHCHVAASPARREMMDRTTVDLVLAFLRRSSAATLDLTGGAPELHPDFRYLAAAARESDRHVIDRCNLTILEEPGQEDLAGFLAGHRIEVIASLPCYLEDNVDRQRGRGAFGKSIRALRSLNELGYGHENSGLSLNLVYNPQDAVLPPSQASLQEAYKRELRDHYGVVFNQLYVLTNMPIQRFGSTLISKGLFQEYMSLLRAAHRRENLDRVMCRSLISVDWKGVVYDCDFNQMLGLELGPRPKGGTHLRDLLDSRFEGQEVHVAEHCYGCTAGAGSSCSGALSATAAPSPGEQENECFNSEFH